jgi:hypothetical protein
MATPPPKNPTQHARGSREAWKQRLSASRRQNLREGLKGLQDRRIRHEARQAERVAIQAAERNELLNRPEREDERLTTPSTGLDVQKLLHGRLEDPTREARLKQKARNLTLHTAAKSANRMDSLHTLYMNARHFIVSPTQLDSALDDEFGTDSQPRKFGPEGDFPDTFSAESTSREAHFDDVMKSRRKDDERFSSEETSMWGHGKPMTVQEMLEAKSSSTVKQGQTAMGLATSSDKIDVVTARVRRLGEKLTGGKMDV